MRLPLLPPQTCSSLELLEPRIAPASLTLGGKLLTYTDLDGDLVKITFTGAAMAEGDFTFPGGFLAGDKTTPQKLDTVNLSGKTGAGFTLRATPQGGKGDSHADINTVNGATTDLGTINIDGDLVQFPAGDNDFMNG